MAMSKTILGSLINAKLNTLTESQKRNSSMVWEAVADAIISHISSEAEIASLTQSGITVSLPSSVTNQGATVSAKGKIS